MTDLCPKCRHSGYKLKLKRFKEILMIQTSCNQCGEFRGYYDERLDGVNLDNTILIEEEN